MKRVPTAILPVAETTTTAVPEPSRAPAQIRVLRCPLPNGRTPPSAASARTAGIRDRKSVASGKSVSVRVCLGGRRTVKKIKCNLQLVNILVQQWYNSSKDDTLR